MGRKEVRGQRFLGLGSREGPFGPDGGHRTGYVRPSTNGWCGSVGTHGHKWSTREVGGTVRVPGVPVVTGGSTDRSPVRERACVRRGRGSLESSGTRAGPGEEVGDLSLWDTGKSRGGEGSRDGFSLGSRRGSLGVRGGSVGVVRALRAGVPAGWGVSGTPRAGGCVECETRGVPSCSRTVHSPDTRRERTWVEPRVIFGSRGVRVRGATVGRVGGRDSFEGPRVVVDEYRVGGRRTPRWSATSVAYLLSLSPRVSPGVCGFGGLRGSGSQWGDSPTP